MRVYGHIPAGEEDGNLYSNPIHSAAAAYSLSFPSSLQKKCSSDTVLSEDYTDDYAEPQFPVAASENIYAQAGPPASQVRPPVNNQYSRPLSPGSTPAIGGGSQPFRAYTPPPKQRFSPPQRHSPPKTLNLQVVYGAGARRIKQRSASQVEIYSPGCPAKEDALSPSLSSLSSVDRVYARYHIFFLCLSHFI